MTRRALPAEVSEAIAVLVKAVPGITGVALVGSWARDEARDQSDIDLIVLTETPEELLEREGWFGVFDRDAQLVSRRDFGAIQERRLRLPNGLEIEVGIGRPEWAATDPIDEGTLVVAAGGLIPLFDPPGVLADLLRAIRRAV